MFSLLHFLPLINNIAPHFLPQVVSHVCTFFRQYVPQFSEAAKSCRARVEQQTRTVMKSFNAKDMRTFPQFLKQKKKLFADALEWLATTLPRMRSAADPGLVPGALQVFR